MSEEKRRTTLCVVSSQVVSGQVGLNAILPALRQLGIEGRAIPTTLLASHPGQYPDAGPPAHQAIPAETLQQLGDWLIDVGALHNLDGILTGYMPSIQHVEATASFIKKLRAMNPNLPYLCDPICGDQGRLYIPEDVACAIREQLIPLANIATPNLFELEWLSQQNVATHEEIFAAAKKLQCPEVVITSAPAPRGSIANIRVFGDEMNRCETICQPHHIHGMGDVFSALYLGMRLSKPENAFAVASATMAELAKKAWDDGRLSFEPIELAAPAKETHLR
jgi:pyridoxine kinase